MGLWFLWFYVQELQKAQPAVALVLKRFRRQGNGLKSHPTDCEMPVIEPATPWFTRHRFTMCSYIIYTQNNVIS